MSVSTNRPRFVVTRRNQTGDPRPNQTRWILSAQGSAFVVMSTQYPAMIPIAFFVQCMDLSNPVIYMMCYVANTVFRQSKPQNGWKFAFYLPSHLILPHLCIVCEILPDTSSVFGSGCCFFWTHIITKLFRLSYAWLTALPTSPFTYTHTHTPSCLVNILFRSIIL